MKNVGVEWRLYCLTSTVLLLNENNSCEAGIVKLNFMFNVECCVAVNIKVHFLEISMGCVPVPLRLGFHDV